MDFAAAGRSLHWRGSHPPINRFRNVAPSCRRQISEAIVGFANRSQRAGNRQNDQAAHSDDSAGQDLRLLHAACGFLPQAPCAARARGCRGEARTWRRPCHVDTSFAMAGLEPGIHGAARKVAMSGRWRCAADANHPVCEMPLPAIALFRAACRDPRRRRPGATRGQAQGSGSAVPAQPPLAPLPGPSAA